MYKEERHLERCFNLPAYDKQSPRCNPLFQYNLFKPGRMSSQQVFKAYLFSSEAYHVPLQD